MSAKEAERGGKRVVLADFGSKDCESEKPFITELPIPVFQELALIAGDMNFLESRLLELRECGSKAWRDVVYEGEPVPGLRERLIALTAGSGMEILRVKDARIFREIPGTWGAYETLGEMDASDVFLRCLEVRKVPEEARGELLNAYREVLASLEQEM